MPLLWPICWTLPNGAVKNQAVNYQIHLISTKRYLYLPFKAFIPHNKISDISDGKIWIPDIFCLLEGLGLVGVVLGLGLVQVGLGLGLGLGWVGIGLGFGSTRLDGQVQL